MKPLEGNFASNAIKHGVAGLNIDACRINVGVNDAIAMSRCNTVGSGRMKPGGGLQGTSTFSRSSSSGKMDTSKGRFPANVIHDGSEEVVKAFPITSSPSPYVQQTRVRGEVYHLGSLNNKAGKMSTHHGDSGSASRFFKQVKES
jgi:site-specific DNA-methyltransferase (adenine-specific)